MKTPLPALVCAPEGLGAAPPPAEAVVAASKLSEGIADEGLREALTRLGARVLTKPPVK